MNNLPPGVLLRDLDGPPMPKCERCSDEHNDEDQNGLCPDCQPEETNEDLAELLRAMRAGHWPPLPEIKPITTKLATLL